MRNWCLGVSLFGLLGCAAQSSYVEANRTRELVRQAMEVAPGDPDSLRAQISLEAGETSLGEARYGRATDRFQEAQDLAQKVLAKNQALPMAEVSPKVQQQIAREAQAEESQSLQADEGMDELPEESEDRRMGLPAEALAKYLSMKESIPLEIEDFEVVAPKRKLPLPGDKSVRTSQMKTSEEVSSPIPEGAKLIEASGEIAAKTAPVMDEAPSNGEEVDDLPLGTDSEPQKKSSQAPKRERKRLPGLIGFPPKEQALNDSAMNELDQLSRFLVENPSNTLIFQATAGPNEAESLIESRFTSIRSYLSARGVPDDQVRLDDQKKQGPNGGFEMFVIEH